MWSPSRHWAPEAITPFEDPAKSGSTDNHHLQQVTRRVVGRFVGSKLRRRTMTIPIVIDA